jgi:hypothetical protein
MRPNQVYVPIRTQRKTRQQNFEGNNAKNWHNKNEYSSERGLSSLQSEQCRSDKLTVQRADQAFHINIQNPARLLHVL